MIFDIATIPVSPYSVLELLSQSHPCPDLSPERFHSLILQLPVNQRIFVCNEDGKEIGIISVLIEQRLSHGGYPVAHISDLETDASCDTYRVCTELITRAIEEARSRSCCRVVVPVREERHRLFEGLGFSETQGLHVLSLIRLNTVPSF